MVYLSWDDKTLKENENQSQRRRRRIVYIYGPIEDQKIGVNTSRNIEISNLYVILEEINEGVPC